MKKNETNKKLDVLLTETTGISIVLVGMLIAVAVYIVTIQGATIANSKEISEARVMHMQLRQAHISHTRIADENMSEIKQDIGELKGMVRILLENQNKK